MSHTPLPVSVVTVAGRLRDNRRGQMQVKAMGEGFANLVIDQAPAFGMPGQRTTIALDNSEGKITDLVGRLREMADALEQVTSLDEWRQHDYDEPETHRPFWWQDYPTTAEAGA